MRDSTRQSLIGWGLVLGVILIVCGIGGMWVFGVSGVYRGTYTRTPGTNQITDAGAMNYVPITILVILVGVILSLGCLFYGHFFVKNQNKGKTETEEYCKVIARFAIDRTGQMLNEWWDLEDGEKLRYYVKLQIPNKPEIIEFECDVPVFHAALEGSSGQATFQGRWLGRYVVYMGDGSGPNDYQP